MHGTVAMSFDRTTATIPDPSRSPPAARAFVLSPATLTGVRGSRILAGEGDAPFLEPLLGGGAVPLSEVYASISSLYFRGKLAYARAFAHGDEALPPLSVITPDRGLVHVDEPVTLQELRRFSRTPIDPGEPRYLRPLLTSAGGLRDALPDAGEVVLLGSIASSKYVDPLADVLGDRLLIPVSFIGRGDMSRGGLMLRAVSEGRELEYAVARSVSRSGPRPPRLDAAATRPSPPDRD